MCAALAGDALDALEAQTQESVRLKARMAELENSLAEIPEIKASPLMEIPDHQGQEGQVCRKATVLWILRELPKIASALGWLIETDE